VYPRRRDGHSYSTRWKPARWNPRRRGMRQEIVACPMPRGRVPVREKKIRIGLLVARRPIQMTCANARLLVWRDPRRDTGITGMDFCLSRLRSRQNPCPLDDDTRGTQVRSRLRVDVRAEESDGRAHAR